MRGRPVDPDRWRALEIEAASELLRASLPKQRSNRVPSRASIEAVRAQADIMRTIGNFGAASPMHLVALWCWAFSQTYEIEPAMTGREWQLATFAAASLAKSDFSGKVYAVVPFLRWTWAEERRSLAWRRENGRTVTPLGWRVQFSRRHLVKWLANGGRDEQTRRLAGTG